jgi:hypothetical protein
MTPFGQPEQRSVTGKAPLLSGLACLLTLPPSFIQS